LFPHFDLFQIIQDTGIFPTHDDFGDRASCEYVLPGKGDRCDDENGHGTNVAGIIGGEKYGVAKNATLIGLRVLSRDGKGTMSGIAAGIDIVVAKYLEIDENERPPTVINLR